MVGINLDSAAANQGDLTARAAFPLLQDVPAVNAVGLLGANKDDFLLFDSRGDLAQYLPVLGGPNTNLATDDGVRNLRGALLSLD